MRYLLAFLPIAVVLVLMIRLKWGAHKAGLAGLATGLVVAMLGFGLTPEVLWVSQAKGILLSIFVLAVMWPALLLYHWIDQNGGVSATARLLQTAVPNRGMCLLLMAWALSGMLEGIAGFGLPIAVVAPMLAALDVPPLTAVAAVAVGHAWAVTFGDMGVILQTLSAVVGIPVLDLVPCAGMILGFACLICGLLAALILGGLSHWPQIAGLSVVMAATQYSLAAAGLVPLSAFGAGLSGLLVYLVCARMMKKVYEPEQQITADQKPGLRSNRPALLAITCYGALMLLMAVPALVPSLRRNLQNVAWRPHFGSVSTSAGFQTPAGPGQVFRPLVHPGTLILLVACASIVASSRCAAAWPAASKAVKATVQSAGLASAGIIAMVGLSMLMDHCGMSYLLAEGLSKLMGKAYPLVSPGVGILGAFATGSNNNSNMLFGSLQKSVATLLHIQPEVLIAAQTAGGSLGSMLAPAKIVVGCSTVGQVGREGQVLRKTVPLGLAAGVLAGVLTLVLSRLR